jgi:hypothetical protein
MWIYVQDKDGQPLMPTRRYGKVRHWLANGRAVVVRREPFTLRLLDREGGYTQPLEAGIDLGSAHVGVSVVSAADEVFSGEFELRTDISGLLTDRRQFRRGRRGRKTRQRSPRFLNRKHRDELAPSVRAKVEETLKMNQRPLDADGYAHAYPYCYPDLHPYARRRRGDWQRLGAPPSRFRGAAFRRPGRRNARDDLCGTGRLAGRRVGVGESLLAGSSARLGSRQVD